jgi:hypothetical protein
VEGVYFYSLKNVYLFTEESLFIIRLKV